MIRRVLSAAEQLWIISNEAVSINLSNTPSAHEVHIIVRFRGADHECLVSGTNLASVINEAFALIPPRTT